MTRALAVLFSLVLLVGCGADTDSDTASDGDNGTNQTESPRTEEPEADEDTETPRAAGDLITGTGYSYTAPDGWGVPAQQAPGFNPDSLAVNLSDADEFVDNINVILSPAGEVTPDQVEEAGTAELEEVGATDIQVNDRTTVSGSESAHLSASMSTNDIEYDVHQFYATNEGQTYVITFSFSPSVPPADRAEVYDAALATWTWTD